MSDIYQGKPINLDEVEFPKNVKSGIHRPGEKKPLSIQADEPFYPIEIHRIDEEDQTYYLAFLVDLGASACSATGDTIEEALETLGKVKKEIVAYLTEKGEPIPEPSVNPFDRHAPTFIGEALKDVKQRSRYISDHLQAIFPMITSDDLLAYLQDENNPWRSVLLTCMADYDYIIASPALRYLLLTFLVKEDRELARSAALALHASGGVCEVSLRKTIKEYNLVSIQSLIQLVEG